MSSAVFPGTERTLRYEGFPLEAVLARVHAAHGSDVTISAADRVRRGGIGGFFAKETFQVTVTVPAAPAREVAEPRFVPLGRLSVFGRDDDWEADRADFDPAFEDIDPEDVDGALSLPARNDEDDEIWALLAAAATATPAVVSDVVPVGAVDPVDVPVAVSAVAPAAQPAIPPVAQPAVEPAAAEVVAEVPEIVRPIDVSGPIASTTLIPAAPSSVAGTPFDPVFAAPRPVDAAVADAGRTTVDLVSLVERFDPVPPAPVVPTAGVIAVVGTRDEALVAAGRLARQLGIRSEDVIVAGPSADVVVPSTEDAMRLAATTRFRCTPVAVIVVELVAGRLGHEWVRVVLDGLRPEQVRFAADLGRLLSHQHLSVAAIGGVDAFDVLAATAHPAPADVLRLATPVATLDGRSASPELWAATILAAAVGGDASSVPMLDVHLSEGGDDRPLPTDRSVVS